MPNYSLRSVYCSEPTQEDAPIGLFPDKESALSELNRALGNEGKPCTANIIIKAFTLSDPSMKQLCVYEYSLIESILENKVELHPLFPARLQLDPLKTTNAQGSFNSGS
jgi:hypothetical protein